MKAKIKISLFVVMVFSIIVGCKKDNLDAPSSLLTGNVVYDGQAIGVRSGTAVQLELWQRGYANFEKIRVMVAQDGSFSARLFDGDYKLTMSAGGPWVFDTDSIDVQVRGNTIVDFPVTPYTIVESANYQRSGNNINATVNLQSVNTAQPLESVRFYISKTILVDNEQKDAVVTLNASDIADVNLAQNLSLAIPASLANAEAVYVRVGVKVVGVGELAYSPVEKIQLN